MASKRAEKARLAVLDAAAAELDELANGSDLVRIEAVRKVDVKGWPPAQTPVGWPSELYRVTYLCTGFVGLTATREPIRGDFHQMALYLTKDYPAVEPKLAWMTPIWHPNIEHAGARHVCTDAPETHRTLRPLSELLIFIGEMVQYKVYHAKHEAPWPLDVEAAKWVLEEAEPRGWVSPTQPIDERPIMRPQAIRQIAPPRVNDGVQRRIVFGRSRAEIEAEAAQPPSPARMRFSVDPSSFRS